MTRHHRALLAELERTRGWTVILAAAVLAGLVLTCGPGPRGMDAGAGAPGRALGGVEALAGRAAHPDVPGRPAASPGGNKG